jgi:hypothetical protein
MNYHPLFQDHRGNIFSHANLVADSNDVAIDMARRVYRFGIGAGYEIWEAGHHVHTESAISNTSH